MKKLLCRLLGIVTLVLFISCEQDANGVLNNELSSSVLKTNEFVYKGIRYSEMKGDIQKHLGSLPELALYIDENGGLEYFDNNEELLKKVCEKNSYVPIEGATRAAAETASSVTLYKDNNYKGGNITYKITSSGTRWIHVSDLSSVGFSQNVSSARMTVQNPGSTEYGTLFTAWDGVSYTGITMVFNLRNSEKQWLYPNLSAIPRSVYGANWNDAIRSFKLNFYSKPTSSW